MRIPLPITSRRQPDGLPLLWHLKVSNYNEKARWALDVKRVPHRRRAVDPPSHHRIARQLTGAGTFPVLVVDGEAIGDSTRIIAALERRHPHPPLYPADPEEREHALALEDFFDEELGPYVRRLVVHHVLPDAELMLATFAPDLGTARRLVARTTFPTIRRRLIAQFGIDDTTVAIAYAKIRAAGSRLRAAVGSHGYLAADTFTVADLTLASLVAPAVTPNRFPYPQPQRDHPLLTPVRAALADAGILEWTHAMYERHRGTSAEALSESSRP